MSTKSSRNYKAEYVYATNDHTNGNVIKIYDSNGKEKGWIPLLKYANNIYIALLSDSTELGGTVYPKGTIIKYQGPDNNNDNNYTIITNSSNDYNLYNDFFKTNDPVLISKTAPKSGIGKPAVPTTSLNNKNTVKLASNLPSDRLKSTSNTSSTKGSSSTSSISSATTTGSTTSTDSTTRSFDFLDDVLGTQKEDSKDKTTELDPNQIANTIVNETKLNDTAISSLVSTYLNSLYRINRSYNTQTK